MLLNTETKPNQTKPIAQSAGIEEYTDCISAEVKTPHPNESQGYDTKPSGCKTPILEISGT